MASIQLINITKTFQTKHLNLTILKNISLEIMPHSFIAITGPSGSGKSTLMYLLGCLDRPSSGEYYFNNKRIDTAHDMDLAMLRNKEIGFIFQRFHLIPGLSALENVALPLLYAGTEKDEAMHKAHISLTHLQLEHRLNHFPYQLSGGQQQRVAIARALINKPSLILADEPTGSLDSATSQIIMSQFKAIHAEQKCTIVMVTHETDIAAQAQRIITCSDGIITKDTI